MGRIKGTIIASLVIVGITAVSSQIIFLRELIAVFYGNEISIGLILAIWLASGAVGSGIFARIASRVFREKVLAFAFLEILASILIPFGIILSRTTRLYFNTTPGEILSMPLLLFWSIIILSPTCIVLAMLFVLGCNIYKTKDAAQKIGSTYILEAAGSTIGGAITSLFLIRFLNSIQIASLLSLCNLGSAYLIAGAGDIKTKGVNTVRFFSLVLVILLILSSAIGGLEWVQGKTTELKWKGLDLIEVRDSIYGNNVLSKQKEQYSFFSNGLLMFSAPDALTSEETVHFPMLLHPDPKKVLLIGGGISEVTKEILKYPVEKVDYVELDPQVIALAKKHLKTEPYYCLNDKRVSIINRDARFYVRQTQKQYDVCIINLPNPYNAQINRLYTKEFFKSLKRILNPGAIVRFGVSSSENYISPAEGQFLISLRDTAACEFRVVKIIPGDTAHFLLSDKEGLVNIHFRNFANLLKTKKIDTLFVNDYYLFSKLSDERIAYLEGALSEAKGQRLNLDFRPISYYYDMVLWGSHFGSNFFKLFNILNERLITYLLLLFFLFVIVLSLVYKGKEGAKKKIVLFALGTTGFSEISFQMFIILAFQILYGYLYYRLGIIITSFMVGLSLGSLYITKRLDAMKNHYSTYINVQGLVCLYPLILLCIFSFLSKSERTANFWISSNALFASLPFIAGFVGGVQFPLANKICLATNFDISRTAGATYAIDLMGSCVGALLISAVFIPILGIAGSCILIFMLNFASLIGLIILK